MKLFTITTFALIVGASAMAQTNKNVSKRVISEGPAAAKDTLLHVTFSKGKAGVLFQALEAFGPVMRRSPDMSALQADEAIKNIIALEKEIYDQIKPQLPADSIKKK